eukprot:1134359-Pelagomonas_calceolata.AAC.1
MGFLRLPLPVKRGSILRILLPPGAQKRKPGDDMQEQDSVQLDSCVWNSSFSFGSSYAEAVCAAGIHGSLKAALSKECKELFF